MPDGPKDAPTPPPRLHMRAGRLHRAATCSGEPGCVETCGPPRSLVCTVSGGGHHTTESLRTAAVTEIEDALGSR